MFFRLSNKGASSIVYRNTKTGEIWKTATDTQDNFSVTRSGTGGAEFLLKKNGHLQIGPGGSTVFSLDPWGNLEIQGNLVANGTAKKDRGAGRGTS